MWCTYQNRGDPPVAGLLAYFPKMLGSTFETKSGNRGLGIALPIDGDNLQHEGLLLQDRKLMIEPLQKDSCNKRNGLQSEPTLLCDRSCLPCKIVSPHVTVPVLQKSI